MLQRFWPFNSYQCWCLSSPCNMNTISTMQVKALFWNRTKLQENVENLEGRFTNHTLRVKVEKWILPPLCLHRWKSYDSLRVQCDSCSQKYTIKSPFVIENFANIFVNLFCVAVWIFLHLKKFCFSLVYWYICTIIWNFVIQHHRLNIKIIFWAW